MDGILIVDKPKGVSSHDIVDFVRRRFQISKVGHAGTLDPLATGVLVILLGRLTKMSASFSCADKAYQACLTLGIATDTYDAQGKIVSKQELKQLSLEYIEQALCQFLGQSKQIPPMFSALKIKGRKLYKLARKGQQVPREPRQIHIYKIQLTKICLPDIYFMVECSKGTYIRTLCVDIAKKLDCLGYMSELRRIRLGAFTIDEAIPFAELSRFSPAQLCAALLPNGLSYVPNHRLEELLQPTA